MDFSSNFYCYLLDALDAEYFGWDEIVEWADRIIIQCDAPKIWLVNLSLIKKKDGSCSLEYEDNWNLRASLHEACFGIYYGACYKGFLFLKYLEGRSSQDDILNGYREKTTHDDAIWDDLLPEMKAQLPLAKDFLRYMMRDDLYEVIPGIFNV